MASNGWPLTRRGFLGVAAGAFALPSCLTDLTSVSGDTRILARPGEPTGQAVHGVTRLGLGGSRDGFLYIPTSYQASQPAPLLVMLHGAGGSAEFWNLAGLGLRALADARGIVLVAPDSREATWDVILHNRFDGDRQFINQALALAFNRCRIDPTRLGLAGFSDGGTYALSLGLPNGDLFTHLLAFSPGYIAESERHGKPRVFMSHGTQDAILGIATTSRVIAPRLRQWGYDLNYQEFEGGHVISLSRFTSGLDWFVGG